MKKFSSDFGFLSLLRQIVQERKKVSLGERKKKEERKYKGADNKTDGIVD